MAVALAGCGFEGAVGSDDPPDDAPPPMDGPTDGDPDSTLRTRAGDVAGLALVDGIGVDPVAGQLSDPSEVAVVAIAVE